MANEVKAIRDAAGLWSDLKETGLQYERRLRKGWRKRGAVNYHLGTGKRKIKGLRVRAPY